ncbi:MAG: hypothetical protein BZ136_03865 [Methanosphaera sp. rholeuAM74]|nr:MAG: hypothetical protein BZ136_03865 [Methanosphaera sp. rholeuAM74]
MKAKKMMLLVTLLVMLVGLASASEVSDDTISADAMDDSMAQEPAPATTTVQESVTSEAKESKLVKDDKNSKRLTYPGRVNVSDFDTFRNVLTNESTNYASTLTINIVSGFKLRDVTVINVTSFDKVIINGSGNTIDGDNKYMFLSIETASANFHANTVYYNVEVVINNTNIINCSDRYGGVRSGGAIYNTNNTLTIINSTLNNNNATSGGAIYNGGNLTIINSTIINNRATHERGCGGAIYNFGGNLKLINSTLSNNTVTGKYGEGGAVYTSDLTITNCMVNDNKATGKYGKGGAISYTSINMTNSTLSNNGAIGESGVGGAMSNRTFYPSQNITDNMLINNNPFINVVEENGRYNIRIVDDNGISFPKSVLIYLNGAYEGNYSVSKNSINWNKQLDNGEYLLSIVFNGNTVYYNFNIEKPLKQTIICLDNIPNVQYSDDAVISGVLVDEVGNPVSDAYVTAYVNQNAFSLPTDASGLFTFAVEASVIGLNNVSVIYAGSGEYVSSNASATFNVTQMGTIITLNSISNAVYDSNTVIRGRLSDSHNRSLSNQNVKVNVEGVEVTVRTNTAGTFSYTTVYNVVGERTVIAIYPGTDKYASSYDTISVVVSKADTSISVNDIAVVEYSDNVAITGSCTGATGVSISNAMVVLMINDVEYDAQTDADGYYAINYTANRVGTNNVTASFGGNSVYNGADASTTFLVNKKDTLITLNNIANTEYSDKITITGRFTRSTGVALKNATITLLINNVSYRTKTDRNGNYALNYTATKVGTNNVTASFGGNSVYNGADTSATFTVGKKDTIIVLDDVSGAEYSDRITIGGRFTRSTGVALSNASIALTVNGVGYTVKTDANGNFAINYTLTRVGTNNITALFNGNSVYNKANTTKTFTVNKKDTVIVLDDVSGAEYSDRITIGGRFTRSTGVALSNASIVLTVNGVRYTVKTDAAGFFAINYTVTKVGVNNVTASFGGNSVYNAADVSGTFTVIKKDTVLTLNDIPDTEYSSTITITGTFTRNTGVPLKNATITIKINNVNYNTKTDTDGNFAINYTANTLGTNNVTAVFKGNSVYNSINATRTFTVTD